MPPRSTSKKSTKSPFNRTFEPFASDEEDDSVPEVTCTGVTGLPLKYGKRGRKNGPRKVQYEVQKILEHIPELDDMPLTYLIKWRGYSEPSWEPEESLNHCPRILREYWENYNKKEVSPSEGTAVSPDACMVSTLRILSPRNSVADEREDRKSSSDVECLSEGESEKETSVFTESRVSRRAGERTNQERTALETSLKKYRRMKAEKNRKKRFHCTSTSSAAKKDSPTIVIEDDDDEEPEDDLLEEAPKVKWGRSRRTKSQDAPGRKRIGDRWKELFPSNKKLNVSAVTIEDYVEANEASSDISIPIIITDDEADLNERRNTTKLPNSDGNLVHAAAGKRSATTRFPPEESSPSAILFRGSPEIFPNSHDCCSDSSTGTGNIVPQVPHPRHFPPTVNILDPSTFPPGYPKAEISDMLPLRKADSNGKADQAYLVRFHGEDGWRLLSKTATEGDYLDMFLQFYEKVLVPPLNIPTQSSLAANSVGCR